MSKASSFSVFAVVLLLVAACSQRTPPSVSNTPASQPPIMVSPIPSSDEKGQIAVSVLVLEVNNEPAASYFGYRTYLFRADGDRLGLLADGGDPAWSPDGSRLAYTAFYDNDHQGIFVLSADGTLSHLTDSGSGELGSLPTHRPVWSPDGSQIAFQVSGQAKCLDYCPDPFDIYVMNSDGSDLTRLGEGLAPAWSPRGSRLAFVTSEDDATISVIDLGGTEPVITPLSGTTPRRRSPLAWSPDGTHIAYVRVEGNSPNSAGIAVVDVSSGQVTKLTSSFDHDPAWSPDGTQLTFTRGSAYQEIHVMNVDGSGLTRLTFGEDTKVSDSQPIWSPDGGQVAFLSISEARGTARICLINADGTGAECLMKDMGVGTQDIRMAWRP